MMPVDALLDRPAILRASPAAVRAVRCRVRVSAFAARSTTARRPSQLRVAIALSASRHSRSSSTMQLDRGPANHTKATSCRTALRRLRIRACSAGPPPPTHYGSSSISRQQIFRTRHVAFDVGHGRVRDARTRTARKLLFASSPPISKSMASIADRARASARCAENVVPPLDVAGLGLHAVDRLRA